MKWDNVCTEWLGKDVAHNKSSVNKSKRANEKKTDGILTLFWICIYDKNNPLKFLKEMSIWIFYISSNFLLLWGAWKLTTPRSLSIYLSLSQSTSLSLWLETSNLPNEMRVLWEMQVTSVLFSLLWLVEVILVAFKSTVKSRISITPGYGRYSSMFLCTSLCFRGNLVPWTKPIPKTF